MKTCTKLICQQQADRKDGENMKKTITILSWTHSDGLSSLNSYFNNEQDINFGCGSPTCLTR